MTQPEQFATLPALHYQIGRRLGTLERRSSTTLLPPVDGAGAAWNAGNTNWIDPTTCPEWSELRVSNTSNGSHVYRCLSNTAGALVWVLVA